MGAEVRTFRTRWDEGSGRSSRGGEGGRSVRELVTLASPAGWENAVAGRRPAVAERPMQLRTAQCNSGRLPAPQDACPPFRRALWSPGIKKGGALRRAPPREGRVRRGLLGGLRRDRARRDRGLRLRAGGLLGRRHPGARPKRLDAELHQLVARGAEADLQTLAQQRGQSPMGLDEGCGMDPNGACQPGS
jgi:hypothetical protein